MFDANEKEIKNNIDAFLEKVEIFYAYTEQLKSICEKNLESDNEKGGFVGSVLSIKRVKEIFNDLLEIKK